MSEQLLEGAFHQEALTGRRTAAPCWRRRVPAGASSTQTASYRTCVQSLPIESHWRTVPVWDQILVYRLVEFRLRGMNLARL